MQLPLRLHLVGDPVLHDADGNQVALPGGKPAALFVFVACHLGPIDREAVAELFWPGPGNARQSLRQALSQLRSRLGVDLFPDRRLLHLTQATVALDLHELAGLRSAGDAARLKELVRGPLCEGLDLTLSPGLQDWFVDFAKRANEVLAGATQRVAADLISSGRAREADELLRHVARCGLSEDALRRSLRSETEGDPRSEAPAAHATGNGGGGAAEAGILTGLHDHSPVRLVLARGSTDEVHRTIEQARAAAASPVSYVAIPEGAPLEFPRVLALVLDRLSVLPGGAGRSAATDSFRARLTDEGAESDALREDAVAALDDAIDAVAVEGPIVFALPLGRAPAHVVDVLTRALARRTYRGVLVVAHAERVADLASVPAASLESAVAEVRRIDLRSEVPSAAMSAHPVAGRWSVREALRRPYTRWAAAAVAVAGFLALGLDPALNGLFSSPAQSPRPSFDAILCAEGDTTPRLYYSAESGFMERVSGPGDGICQFAIGAWVPSRDMLLTTGTPAGRQQMTWDGLPAYGLMVFRPGSNLREDWTGTLVADPEILGGVPSFFVEALRDDRWLAFSTSDGSQGAAVLVLDLETGEIDQIAEASGEPAFRHRWVHPLPVWDRTSPRLYWRSWNGSSYEIRSMTWPDGTPTVAARAETDLLVVAAFGDTLLVERGPVGDRENGSLEIGYLLLAENGRFEPITRNEWNDADAKLSPDGTRICWRSEEYGHFRSNIRTHDRTTGETRVLSLPGRQDGCRWAPDSRGVLFSDHRETGVMSAFVDEGFTEPFVFGTDLTYRNHVVALVASGTR